MLHMPWHMLHMHMDMYPPSIDRAAAGNTSHDLSNISQALGQVSSPI